MSPAFGLEATAAGVAGTACGQLLLAKVHLGGGAADAGGHGATSKQGEKLYSRDGKLQVWLHYDG